jgi:hypothetical protein
MARGGKISGPAGAGRPIIDDMFRHAVLAWPATAGLVAAAPARAAADSPAVCLLPGKRS